MRYVLLTLLILAPLPAFAQTFTPYTIDATKQQQLLNYLGEQPAKFSLPVINALNQYEVEAQAAAKKAAEEKAKPEKPKGK